MIETFVMVALFTVWTYMARWAYANVGTIRFYWSAARWYEKVALVLLIVPIPGPIDEIVALIAINRIRKRIVLIRS